MGNFYVLKSDAWEKQGGGGKFSQPESTSVGHNTLLIETEKGDNKIIIKSVLKKPFDYQFDSEWSTMSEIDLPLVTDALNLVIPKMGGLSMIQGRGEMGSVFNSQKMWKKSGYLSITAEIRIIDFDGKSGSPLDNASKLVALCIPPTYAGDGGALGGATAGAIGIVNTAASTGVGVAGYTGLTSNEGGVRSEFGSEDIGIYRDAPSTVTVKWGNMFTRTDMIVESVSLNPSKEIYNSTSGYSPLYVDAVIKFSSRTILRGNSKEEIGFGSNAKGRVVGTMSVDTSATSASNN